MICKIAFLACIIGFQEGQADSGSVDTKINSGLRETSQVTSEAGQSVEKDKNGLNEKLGTEEASKDPAEAILATLSQIVAKRLDWLNKITSNSESPMEGRDARRRILERKLSKLPDRMNLIIEADTKLRKLTAGRRTQVLGMGAVQRTSAEVLVNAIDTVIAKQESLSQQLMIVRRAREESVELALFVHAQNKASGDYGQLIASVCESASMNGQSPESIAALRSVLTECEDRDSQMEFIAFRNAIEAMVTASERRIEMLKNNPSRELERAIKELADLANTLSREVLFKAMNAADKRGIAAVIEAEQWSEIMEKTLAVMGKPTQEIADSRAEVVETLGALKSIHAAVTKADELMKEICQNLTLKPQNYQEEVEVLILELDSLPDQSAALEQLKKRKQSLLSKLP